MKMRNSVALFGAIGVSALVAFAAEKKPLPQSDPEPDVVSDSAESGTVHQGLTDTPVGFYVGQFGPGKITVRLEKIVGDSVLGYSVTGGNQRAFSGTFAAPEGVPRVVAREPGDNPTDGVFRFDIPAGEKSLVGIWTANNKKIKPINFTLKRRDFRYNPKAGNYPQSSTLKLNEDDVSNLQREQLRIMRNEMYARHGYSFKIEDMRRYFDQQDWYMPMLTDVSTKLTALEQKNHELIKRYENYSQEYYDSFGR